jgi:hypothetical protein
MNERLRELTNALGTLNVPPPGETASIPVELYYWTQEVVKAIPSEEMIEARARELAREEIASLAGLVLRRLQNTTSALDASGQEGKMVVERGTVDVLSSIFGEILHDFGGTDSEPGTEPTP